MLPVVLVAVIALVVIATFAIAMCAKKTESEVRGILDINEQITLTRFGFAFTFASAHNAQRKRSSSSSKYMRAYSNDGKPAPLKPRLSTDSWTVQLAVTDEMEVGVGLHALVSSIFLYLHLCSCLTPCTVHVPRSLSCS